MALLIGTLQKPYGVNIWDKQGLIAGETLTERRAVDSKLCGLCWATHPSGGHFGQKWPLQPLVSEVSLKTCLLGWKQRSSSWSYSYGLLHRTEDVMWHAYQKWPKYVRYKASIFELFVTRKNDLKNKQQYALNMCDKIIHIAIFKLWRK